MLRRVPTRKVFFCVLAACLLLLLLLAACGGNASSGSPSATSASPANNANASAAATAAALKKLVTLLGQPKVKMLNGTTFEADGQLKNNDTLRHDFTLQVTLLDASGKVIATATKKVEDVKGGATVSYAIQGTISQPNWSSVEVAVIKVSENVNGSGTD